MSSVELCLDFPTPFWTARCPRLPLTVCGLAKVAIFTTNVDAENQTLINNKCVCGVLNRRFFVGAVVRSFFFLSKGLSCQISEYASK